MILSKCRFWTGFFLSVVLGAGSGLAIRELVLKRFVSVQLLVPFVNTPKGDMELSRRVIQASMSGQSFFNFVRIAGLPERDPAVIELNRAVERNDLRIVRVDYDYGINRNDLRDLPESVAREYATQVVKDGLAGGVTITAASRESNQAQRIAEITTRYISDKALRFQLRDLGLQWNYIFTSEYISLLISRSNHIAKQISIEQQLGFLKDLRNSHRIQNSTASTPVDASVQVQVAGDRYLGLGQQVTALEVEKIQLEDEARRFQDKIVRAEVKLRMGAILQPLALNETVLALDSLKEFRKVFDSEQARLLREVKPADKNNIDLVISELSLPLVTLEKRHLEVAMSAPVLRLEVPGKTIAALLGGIFAGVLFISLFVIYIRMKSQRVS